MTKQKEIFTDSTAISSNGVLVAGVQGVAVPILFSTPMVKAIAEGRKTQTRRIIKYKKNIKEPNIGFTAFTNKGEFSVRGIHENGEYGESFFKIPYMKGGMLWVRETFCPKTLAEEPPGERYWYKADYHAMEDKPCKKWKPSLFMPKDACRLFLMVKHIRVEKLHGMTEADAKAEGIYQGVNGYYKNYLKPDWNETGETALDSFKSLWIKINGEESWNQNPYVWVVQFERATGC